jgi:hypothetical protein
VSSTPTATPTASSTPTTAAAAGQSQPASRNAVNPSASSRAEPAAPSPAEQSAHNAPQQQAQAQDDDPELEFGEGLKLKKSEARKRLERQKELERGAYKAMQERAEYEKRVNAFFEKYGFDPERLQQDPDSEFDRIAQERLARKLEEATRDPREVEAERRAKELETREERIKQWEQQREAEQRARTVDQRIQKMSEAWLPAIEAAGLPKDVESIGRLAAYLKAAHQRGEPVTLGDAIEYVKAKHQADIRRAVEPIRTDGAKIAEFLGPEGIEAIRKHLLSQAPQVSQPKTQRSSAPKVITAPRDESNPNGYSSWSWSARPMR